MGRRATSRDLLGIETPKGEARATKSDGRALRHFFRGFGKSADIQGWRSNRRFVFVERLALFERVAGERPRLRRGYTARLVFNQDLLLSGLHAITKLIHIETSSSGLRKDSLRTLLFLMNVMLYLFRQHLDLGVIEFLIWRACD